MRHWFVAVAVASAAVCAASNASAEPFGNKGEIILSADRLMSLFSYGKATRGNASESSVSMSFLWGGQEHLSNFVHSTPRIGFDYTVTDHLTVGGNLIAFLPLSHSVSVPQNDGTTKTQDATTVTLFGIQPRVGYILPLTDAISFWPRGGFSFYSLSLKQTDVTNGTSTSTNGTQFSLNLEPTMVFSPVQNFGFTASLTADIPIAGSVKQDGATTSQDLSLLHIGALVGLLGYF